MGEMQGASRYGVGFDNLADRWAHNENEHDRMHPDRSQCGGVGACPMMREAVDLEHYMIDQLEKWRVKPAHKAGYAATDASKAHVPHRHEDDAAECSKIECHEVGNGEYCTWCDSRPCLVVLVRRAV